MKEEYAMGKTDPYASVRRDNPPPNKVWPSLKRYDRDRIKADFEKELEIWIEEFDEETKNA